MIYITDRNVLLQTFRAVFIKLVYYADVYKNVAFPQPVL